MSFITIQPNVASSLSAHRVCLDCQHVHLKKGEPPMCAAPQTTREFSLVDGTQVSPYCEDTRGPGRECGPDGQLFERSNSLPRFGQAKWRGTTRVDDKTGQIGISFETADGEVVRLQLQAESAVALAQSAIEFHDAYLARLHSRQSSGSPKVEVSTPDDGM